MRVVAMRDDGHARCVGHDGRTQVVDTALVGPCAPGQWLLVFLDSARERIDAARADEIAATLTLLAQALAGTPVDDAPGFVLPSSWSADALAALVGTPAASPEEPR